MKKIVVRLGKRSYLIFVGSGLLKKSGAIIKSQKVGKDAFIITNSRIRRLYGKDLEKSFKKNGIAVRFAVVPASEKSKSMGAVQTLLKKIVLFDKVKSPFIVAFGGGVVGDLAGFVAASYKRGIPYIQVPTTLLGQVDSAIGGKVAIDLPEGKNLVGAFYQPRLVLSDPATLKTLPERELRAGLAEAIKYGVIKDKAFFVYLENNLSKILRFNSKVLIKIVDTCSRIKARVVEADEYDKLKKRMILNFGHTIGHALEAAGGYSARYQHGEAIAVGMVAASEIAEKLKMLSSDEVLRIERLLRRAGLPTKIKKVSRRRILASVAHDKKWAPGQRRFVLPVRIGEVKVVENVPLRIIREAVARRME